MGWVFLVFSVVFFSDDFFCGGVTFWAVGGFAVFDFVDDGECAAVEVADVYFVHSCV